MESKPRVTADQVVGGDLGLHTYLTLSDGTEIPPPRFLRQYAKKLRRAQRQMSRRVQGSRNRAQARLQVAKLYERIRHRRSNFSHQLTHGLMRYPALCLENLGLVGLAKTKLAKSMLDAALGETLRQWKYKSVWYNTHAIQADRFFPSTQLCSACGYQNKNLRLSDRAWQVPCLSDPTPEGLQCSSESARRRDQTTRCYGNPRDVKRLWAACKTRHGGQCWLKQESPAFRRGEVQAQCVLSPNWSHPGVCATPSRS
jgi:Probable transposase